jgi:hypothetical protein
MPPAPLANPGPITRLGRLVQPADANEHGRHGHAIVTGP